MGIKIVDRKSILIISVMTAIILQISCLKKDAQNNLADQNISEGSNPEILVPDISDLKQNSPGGPEITASSQVEPVSEPETVNDAPIIFIDDTKQSKTVKEEVPSLEEVVNNTSDNEIIEENITEDIVNDDNNEKQDKQPELKDGKTLIQEHYGKALSLYDSGEHDKAREELKICLKMIADLELDIEILFRFTDVYRDVFESTASQEVSNETSKEASLEQSVYTETTGVLEDIVQEEKKIMESLDEGKVTYDFPVEFNESVKRYITIYTSSRGRKSMQGRLTRSGKYIDMMKETFKNEGLPQDLAYLPMIESAFKVKAYSRAGAAGLWQFMRKTGISYGLKRDWSIDERYDPVASTKAAAKYLKSLYSIFDSWLLAEAAYNSGEFRILRAMGIARSRDFWYLASKNVLARETRGYVADFMANLIIAKNPEKYGFTNIKYENALEYDEVVIENCVELSFAAGLAGTSVEELKKLNPALRKWCTPIDYPKFVLKIPKGKKDIFRENFEKIAKSDPNGRIGWGQHVVKRGESMSTISWKYGIPISAIAKANNIKNVNKISIGMRLFIPYGKNTSSIAGLKNGNGYKKIVYVIRSGDTLWEIGKKYNVPLRKIKEWNTKFSRKRNIYPGEKLAIWVKEGI